MKELRGHATPRPSDHLVSKAQPRSFLASRELQSLHRSQVRYSVVVVPPRHGLLRYVLTFRVLRLGAEKQPPQTLHVAEVMDPLRRQPPGTDPLHSAIVSADPLSILREGLHTAEPIPRVVLLPALGPEGLGPGKRRVVEQRRRQIGEEVHVRHRLLDRRGVLQTPLQERQRRKLLIGGTTCVLLRDLGPWSRLFCGWAATWCRRFHRTTTAAAAAGGGRSPAWRRRRQAGSVVVLLGAGGAAKAFCVPRSKSSLRNQGRVIRELSRACLGQEVRIGHHLLAVETQHVLHQWSGDHVGAAAEVRGVEQIVGQAAVNFADPCFVKANHVPGVHEREAIPYYRRREMPVYLDVVFENNRRLCVGGVYCFLVQGHVGARAAQDAAFWIQVGDVVIHLCPQEARVLPLRFGCGGREEFTRLFFPSALEEGASFGAGPQADHTQEELGRGLGLPCRQLFVFPFHLRHHRSGGGQRQERGSVVVLPIFSKRTAVRPAATSIVVCPALAASSSESDLRFSGHNEFCPLGSRPLIITSPN
mmetsp:Transcript_20725/g.52222  ORF Transcript_20725/g.52222 Transcript_20725/m.52222 type:complete len:532 (+) Transcript_20725:7203-8798(+)